MLAKSIVSRLLATARPSFFRPIVATRVAYLNSIAGQDQSDVDAVVEEADKEKVLTGELDTPPELTIMDDTEKKEFAPHIEELAESILKLNLLEASDLADCLKVKSWSCWFPPLRSKASRPWYRRFSPLLPSIAPVFAGETEHG